MNRKQNSMKAYILRDPQAVEPQKARLAEARLAAPRGPALYVGLDMHTESIAVSLAASDSTEVRRYGLIGGTHDDGLRLAKKLQAAHPGLPR